MPVSVSKLSSSLHGFVRLVLDFLGGALLLAGGAIVLVDRAVVIGLRFGESPVLALAGRRDAQHLAILRHRPPLDRVASVPQLDYQILVGQRGDLVFVTVDL